MQIKSDKMRSNTAMSLERCMVHGLATASNEQFLDREAELTMNELGDYIFYIQVL